MNKAVLCSCFLASLGLNGMDATSSRSEDGFALRRYPSVGLKSPLRVSSRPFSDEKKVLLLSNLSQSVTSELLKSYLERDILDMYKGAVTVTEVSMPLNMYGQSKGFAFVTFGYDEGNTTIERIAGDLIARPFNIDGRAPTYNICGAQRQKRMEKNSRRRLSPPRDRDETDRFGRERGEESRSRPVHRRSDRSDSSSDD